MEIIGENISLLPYTMERCHEFWKDYVVDYNMWDKEYIYDKNWVNKYFNLKVLDKTRSFFAICIDDKVIGEIQLKNINTEAIDIKIYKITKTGLFLDLNKLAITLIKINTKAIIGNINAINLAII